jgi:hypothetical protein
MDWKNKNGVATLSSVQQYAVVECTQCFFRYDNYTQEAARKNAHRHVAKTGHTVEVHQLRVRTYGLQS